MRLIIFQAQEWGKYLMTEKLQLFSQVFQRYFKLSLREDVNCSPRSPVLLEKKWLFAHHKIVYLSPSACLKKEY